ncbi:Uncharacterised protein [Bordetella pertussis]|nr:Uncharacterised protein [Bordetella pertussis]
MPRAWKCSRTSGYSAACAASPSPGTPNEPAPSRPLTMSSKACSVGAWRPASRSCASMGPWKVTKPA